MLNRKIQERFDRRDEILLTVIALLIPLTTLPVLLGL